MPPKQWCFLTSVSYIKVDESVVAPASCFAV